MTKVVNKMTILLKRNLRLIKVVIATALLSLAIPFTSLSADMLWDSYEEPDSRLKERLVDEADLLTDEEEAEILEMLNNISNSRGCNVAILTVDDHYGNVQDYSDDYFVYNGFLTDFNENGVLFMLSMAEREYAFTTSGNAIYAFTDYGQQRLFEDMASYLHNDDYYNAFITYANTADKYLELYANGTPFDIPDYREQPRTLSYRLRQLFLCILGGLAAALIPIFRMKSQLKTVKMSTNAVHYQASDGIRIKTREDRFINRHISKTPIPKDTGGRSGSGGGGGSTTHSHSSGHTLGGSHGHF